VVATFKKYETPVQVSSEELFRKGNPFLHKEPDAEDLERIKAEQAEKARVQAEIARRKAFEDAEVDIKKIRVSFIMGGSKGRTCMINGNIFKVGGKIEDFEITDIQPNNVTFVRKIPGYEDFKRTVAAGK